LEDAYHCGCNVVVMKEKKLAGTGGYRSFCLRGTTMKMNGGYRSVVEITVTTAAVVVRCNLGPQAYAEHAFLSLPKIRGSQQEGQQGIQWGLLSSPQGCQSDAAPTLQLSSACVLTNRPTNKRTAATLTLRQFSKHSRLF